MAITLTAVLVLMVCVLAVKCFHPPPSAKNIWSRASYDGNANKGGAMPLVDLERIKFFFDDPKVTTVTGQFTEQIVSDVLLEAGFSSFPVAYDVIPRVKMELPNRLWTERKDLILGGAGRAGSRSLVFFVFCYCSHDHMPYTLHQR